MTDGSADSNRLLVDPKPSVVGEYLVANAVVVPPGVGGRVCFEASAPVHVIADVNGWFATGN